MASHLNKSSLRRKAVTPYYGVNREVINPMRPGKTAEDRRIDAHASKAKRNARHEARREALDAVIKGKW